MALFTIEIEPEVRDWLRALSSREFGTVDAHVGTLAEKGRLLGMPLARPLREGVWELRFTLHPNQTRIAYYFAGDTRIVLLTAFHKTQQNERGQVNRAIRAKETCEQGHGPAEHGFSRKG